MSRFDTSRVAYADAGQAMRNTIERAVAADLSPMDHKVLLAIFSYTGTYSRLADYVYLADLAKITYGVDYVEKWQIDKVGRSIKKLAERDVIVRSPPRRGRSEHEFGPSYFIGLNASDPGRISEDEADDEGPVDDEPNASDPGRNSGDDDEGNAPDPGEKCARSRREMRPSSDDPPRSSSEKESEERAGVEQSAADADWFDAERLRARALLVSSKAKNDDMVEETIAIVQKHDPDLVTELIETARKFNWPSEIDKALKKLSADQALEALAAYARGEAPAPAPARCATCKGIGQVLPDIGNTMVPCTDCGGRRAA